MKEITCNIHLHSTYSDGFGTYSSISAAAIAANLDVIILTDHNVWVKGLEGYYENAGKRVLVLTGEEIHNQDRYPQKNHMLVLGAEAELATFASQPQDLINAVRQHGGLSFLAHPDEMALKLVNETDITWVDWNANGYTGFELWNQFSELKTVSRTPINLLRNVFFPQYIATGPAVETLTRRDKFLSTGQHLAVICGADAHALRYHLGPFIKTIFPYRFHFSALNNHLLLAEALSGELEHDKQLIYAALRKGSSFIGYDLPAKTTGFSFTITSDETVANIGDTIELSRGATAQIHLPYPAEIRLIQNGEEVIHQFGKDRLSNSLVKPGAYRVECYCEYLGQKRGWIFSNPIYVI